MAHLSMVPPLICTQARPRSAIIWYGGCRFPGSNLGDWPHGRRAGRSVRCCWIEKEGFGEDGWTRSASRLTVTPLDHPRYLTSSNWPGRCHGFGALRFSRYYGRESVTPTMGSVQ